MGTQRRAGHRRAGRSGRVLGGGPAPESTGAWSQAGASVFIELLPSLHTEAWGLGAGGNAPLHLGPDSADQQGSAGGAEQLHEHGSARAGGELCRAPAPEGLSDRRTHPGEGEGQELCRACTPPPVPHTSPAFVQAGGSVLSGSGCPWRWVTALWWRGSQPGGPFLCLLSRVLAAGLLGARRPRGFDTWPGSFWFSCGWHLAASCPVPSPAPSPFSHSPRSEAPAASTAAPLLPGRLVLSFRGGRARGCLWAGGGPPPPWVTFLLESRALWTF